MAFSSFIFKTKLQYFLFWFLLFSFQFLRLSLGMLLTGCINTLSKKGQNNRQYPHISFTVSPLSIVAFCVCRGQRARVGRGRPHVHPPVVPDHHHVRRWGHVPRRPQHTEEEPEKCVRDGSVRLAAFVDACWVVVWLQGKVLCRLLGHSLFRSELIYGFIFTFFSN